MQYTTKDSQVKDSLNDLPDSRIRIRKMKFAARPRLVMELGINFSSMALLNMQWFLSVFVCLLQTELAASSCLGFEELLSEPLSSSGDPLLSLSSEVTEDFEWVSSSSSVPPVAWPAVGSPEPPPAEFSSPFRALILFCSRSLIFFSFFLFFPIVMPYQS